MGQIWEQNEEFDEEEELVVTDHRDGEVAAAEVEDEVTRSAEEDVRDAVDALGEDVASSPSQRATEVPDDSGP